jgi:hypothetical protein
LGRWISVLVLSLASQHPLTRVRALRAFANYLTANSLWSQHPLTRVGALGQHAPGPQWGSDLSQHPLTRVGALGAHHIHHLSCFASHNTRSRGSGPWDKEGQVLTHDNCHNTRSRGSGPWAAPRLDQSHLEKSQHPLTRVGALGYAKDAVRGTQPSHNTRSRGSGPWASPTNPHELRIIQSQHPLTRVGALGTGSEGLLSSRDLRWI